MTQSRSATATEMMAEFAAGAQWESLPEKVRQEAVRAWLNFVACATGGASTPIIDAALRGILAMAPPGAVPVFGRPERVGLADAALLNSMSTSAYTFDDTHLSTITHPTGPVAAALAAAAHALKAKGQPVSGPELLTSLMVGMELECRVSCAIAAGKANQGWYMTGLSGGIGAAAAVGRLLHLRREQLVDALSLAAAQACGTRSVHGSMAITYVPGVAARDGLVAAYMAQADFTCGAGAIDGRNGLLQVLTGAHDAAPILDDLGQRFEVLNNTYKPYPCGIVIHPAIDACVALVHEDGVRHEAIERIEMRVHPDALNLCWRRLPETALDAQVSLFHWVAAALVRGAAGIAEGEQACVSSPAVRALQEQAEATPDPTLRDNQAAVILHLRGGRKVERFTDNAIGSITNPMTDAQLVDKFRALARRSLAADRVERLLELCLVAPALQDIAEVIEAGAL